MVCFYVESYSSLGSAKFKEEIACILEQSPSPAALIDLGIIVVLEWDVGTHDRGRNSKRMQRVEEKRRTCWSICLLSWLEARKAA